MPTPTIDLDDVCVSFGPNTVLDGLSLSVQPGEIYALLGPNGAGKTTTINILTTLVTSYRGHASVAGFDVARHPREVKERIALTGQAAAVDDALTGTENLVMLGRLNGLTKAQARSRAAELLEYFDLTDAGERRVGTYSGGMRRRLDLALSLVAPAEVLFLDEPTTGLDTRSRRELWQVIRRLADAGTTVLLTTQYLEEADQLADRIGVLSEGRLVAEGTSAELKALTGSATVEVRDASGAVVLSVPTDGTPAGLRAALAEIDAAGVEGEIALHSPTLDDAFLALTERTPA